LWSE